VRFLIKILVLLLCLLILFVGVLFAINNTDKIALDFVFFKTFELSIGMWLVIAMAIGGVIGFLLNSVALIALKARLKRARKKSESADKELAVLRTATVKDPS